MGFVKKAEEGKAERNSEDVEKKTIKAGNVTKHFFKSTYFFTLDNRMSSLS